LSWFQSLVWWIRGFKSRWHQALFGLS